MTEPDRQRLDVWLWHARFRRHRADCTRLVAAGEVRVNSQGTDKPHWKLRVGDVLTMRAADDILVLRVLALAERRGPPDAARSLYEVIPPPT